jgi:hypothetical protein
MNLATSPLELSGWCQEKISQRVLNLAFLLVLLQVLDALLTAIGLDIKGGVSGEGNGFLRYGMSVFGVIPTLVLAKSFAVIFIGALSILSSKVSWIETAMTGLVALYLFAAILPWTMIIVLNAWA